MCCFSTHICDGSRQNAFGVTDMHRVALALQPLMEERFPSACPTLLSMLSGFLPRCRAVLGRIAGGDLNTWSCASGMPPCAMRHLLSRKLHAWRVVQTVFARHRLVQTQHKRAEARSQDQGKDVTECKVERRSFPSSIRGLWIAGCAKHHGQQGRGGEDLSRPEG